MFCILFRLDTEHTAENIKERVLEVLNEYGAEEKVVCSSTDNASNEKAAMNEAGIPNFGCLAHTLNLAVNLAIRIATGVEIDDMSDQDEEQEHAPFASDYEKLHKKISKLVTRTRKSSNAKREFRQCQQTLKPNKKPRKLKQFCATRWNRYVTLTQG